MLSVPVIITGLNMNISENSSVETMFCTTVPFENVTTCANHESNVKTLEVIPDQSKNFFVYAVKACMGNGGIDSLILNIGARWR